jgi:putative integral membrane protein (TIGR02587 family)
MQRDATAIANRDDEDPDPHGWREEGRDLLRGIAAGSIVGMPLLYTMEMWWHGMTVSEWHLVLLLAAILSINFVFCLLSGFRRESSIDEAASESVTAVAIGLLYSLGVLWLVGEITFDGAWTDILGKTLIETAPVSLGISFSNYHVRNRSREGEEDQPEPDGRSGERQDPERRQLKQDLTDLAATVSGSIVFAYNVAPTEEIIKISSRVSPWRHLVLMLASLGLCYMILFAAGFQRRRVFVPGPFQSPLAETAMAYAVSLVVALALLYLVGVPEATMTMSALVSTTVVLGLPAGVGAAAGRLVT